LNQVWTVQNWNPPFLIPPRNSWEGEIGTLDANWIIK
jgi:hypothetical protein